MNKEMSCYEILSLLLTGVYDLLTFGLLFVTVYIGVIQRYIPKVVFYYEGIPPDIEGEAEKSQWMDFILENHGIELRNIKITSDPDELGWGKLVRDDLGVPKKTSEYFSRPVPQLYENEKKNFFWCDVNANREVYEKEFKITLEFDHPISFFGRSKKEFNFPAPQGIFYGVNNKYDIHNVAVEAARIKERLKEIEKILRDNNKNDSQ